MTKKKPSSRKKNTKKNATKLSPFAQAKEQLEQARRFAERDNYSQAWHAVQPAITTFESLADKGNEKYIELYVDALSMAGFIALFMDLPNKSCKLLDLSMSVMLSNTQSNPVNFAKGLVSSTIHIVGVLETSQYANLREKAVDYLQSVVDLLAQLLVEHPSSMASLYYETLRTLAELLINAGRAKEGFVYFDKLHNLIDQPQMVQNASAADSYPVYCLQHANWLLAEEAYDEAIVMADKTVVELNKLADKTDQLPASETMMANCIKAEALFACERYDEVIELAQRLAPAAQQLHQVATTAQASVYLQILQLWADTLQLQDDDIGAKAKFEQILSLMGDTYDQNNLDHQQYYLPVSLRLAYCDLRLEHYNDAVERLEQLIRHELMHNANQHHSISAIEQPLLMGLLCSYQWQKAQQLLQSIIEKSLNDGQFDSQFFNELTNVLVELKQECAEDIEAQDHCQTLSSMLIHWQSQA